MSTTESSSQYYLEVNNSKYKLIAFGVNKKVLKENIYDLVQIDGFILGKNKKALFVQKVRPLRINNLEFEIPYSDFYLPELQFI